MQEKTKNWLYAIGGAVGYAMSSTVAEKSVMGSESRFDANPIATLGSAFSGLFALRGLMATFSPAMGELLALYGLAAWEAHLKNRAALGAIRGRARTSWGPAATSWGPGAF